eukprot:Awhi_evm1s12658
MISSMQTLASEPNSQSGKMTLANATRDLQNALDRLNNICSTSAPGIRECDAGSRAVAGL